MDPDTVPLTFFRKTSGSISGPYDEIVKPGHVRFLDYEIELGLVVGRPLDVGATVTAANWKDHIAGDVVTNDVSARDLQLPKTQFYETKSYPTFTPVGPALVLFDAGELHRLAELQLVLKVNGEIRQNSDLTDMIYSPLRALQELSRFQALATGDLILTGTPVGPALKAPPKPVELLAAFLPPATKWKASHIPPSPAPRPSGSRTGGRARDRSRM
ncbi:fumarylacetoacetate hydrolase family protein [Streptomyces sp. Ag109_O5-1]|uniref:fumarylacetoacetate hydrolase family protein n=1 Tax=Streptomyces sp. Ag109_O5-1 TaxID=1938851 RepID=UPI00288AD730|nr:fumarylacetoacetate hydrolase family protein [Streptomyces sp. Ag109_O5-1]